MGDKCIPWLDHPSHSSGFDFYNHNHCRNLRNPPNRKLDRQLNGGMEGVWCFTGKGDTTWDYCGVPQCDKVEKSPVGGPVEGPVYGPWKDMNTTIAENEDYQIIVTACITLFIVNSFLLIIIFTITVSWCRDKGDIKKEENELESL